MANLHNALCDHALPYRIKAKRMALSRDIVKIVQPKIVENLTTLTKTNDELLTDSKKMVSKLKENIAKDISSLTSEVVVAASVAKQDPPKAPKSPRMHLPIAIPEPVQDKSITEFIFKVPLSPKQ